VRLLGLLLLGLLLPGCALHPPTPGQMIVGMMGRSTWMHLECPDKLPPFVLQDVTCPHGCGFSCLPGRWDKP
jgi:hypothetical protein